jgi:hypothetical protein
MAAMAAAIFGSIRTVTENRRLRDHLSADAAGPHVQGVEPDTLFLPTPAAAGSRVQFDLDTAEGQLFLNRMLMSLPLSLLRRLEPAPGREPRLVRDPDCLERRAR